LFSIVTITLNCVADAERTAHSVLAQDFADFEYIVKDGGSTDATPQRMQEIGVQRVVSTPDSGIYDAMNQGIQLSRGTYVVFMNAGDEFAHAGVLTEVAAYLTRQNYPGFAYGDIRSLVRHPFLQPEQPERGRLIRYPNRLGRFWLYRKMICQQAWFVRREIYTNRPFDQDYRILSDYDYLLNMVLRQRVRVAHIPSVVAIFDGDGVSTRAVEQRENERSRIHATYFAPWEHMLYHAFFERLKWVNRAIVYRWIYPLLPERSRGKVSGL
jgi:putative colanic acid biosynthesis glycosyltransferase